jgi:chemotaxis protein MotB
MTGKWSCRFGVLVLGALGCALLGGCQAVSQDEYDAALLENEELRQRNAELSDQLSRSEMDRQALIADNQALASRASQPAPAAQTSGFENIKGVNVDRNSSGDLVVAVAGDVLFDSGKATLKGSAKSSLDQVAGVLNSRWSSHPIRVEGHTDADPIKKSKWKSNEHLSAERALAVETYLTSKGVDNSRMYSAAFGPDKPRGSKDQSRRVEIVILASAG